MNIPQVGRHENAVIRRLCPPGVWSGHSVRSHMQAFVLGRSHGYRRSTDSLLTGVDCENAHTARAGDFRTSSIAY